MRELLATMVLVLAAASTQAQTITENFGSGTNQFSIEFVTIGNPGNGADTTGSPNPTGSVEYIYNIGKYEISLDQINKANVLGGLEITLHSQDPNWRNGTGVNKPAIGITWFEAAKFVNWLNTSSGYQSAYKFDGAGNFQTWAPTDVGYNSSNLFRNSSAKFWLPSADEWYKAAYGGPSGEWYDYPTGSNLVPTPVARGNILNTAVYGFDPQQGPADITDAGGLSAYGTMAQGGNIWEWTESARDGFNNSENEDRIGRGGSFNTSATATELEASFFGYINPSYGDFDGNLGFRIASVPEPSSLSLLLAAGTLLLGMRKTRKNAI